MTRFTDPGADTARSTRTVANPLSHFHLLRRWVDVSRQAGRRLSFAFGNEEGAAVARLGAAVVGMGLAALVVAYLFFGWPVLLIGVPAFVGVALVVAAVVVSEVPRRKLEEHRATRFDPAAQLPGGLMSGFFEMPKQRPTELPDRIV